MAKSPKKGGIDPVRHSLAHLLAMAVLKKFPEAKLGIGPVIEHGFYYDFLLPAPLSDSDLPELEKTMRALIAANLEFKGEKISREEARTLFKDQPFKLDLIEEFTKESRELTLFRTRPSDGSSSLPDSKFVIRGSVFNDLCRGGHVENTSEIDSDAFALTKLAGAYWRGNEKNPQLTRIYGLAFAAKKELDAHRAMLEEAKKRDHKKLGPELDLFTFSELVGPGLPLWTPKGTLLRDILDDVVWKLRKEQGYERVDIPHITKKDLYEKSGHWDKYKDDLFKIETRDGHFFAMKPMNCPHHTQIYARRQWSWRELPQRYASTTKVYRDEQSGELAGLSRVLSITQDDAHVFCRIGQAKEEIRKIWGIVHGFYGTFGLKLTLRLSVRDPNHPEKYLGDKTHWDKAEAVLREIAKENDTEYEEAPGEAAFYAPKLDFMTTDSIGREWQVATIQLDVNMPERFNLFCINEKGERERIIMIHAAVMGSLERFLSILIEHYAGAFPFWLAPVQAMILPVSEKFIEYAERVWGKLRAADIRVEIDHSNETLGKKIRAAEMQKVPYLLVVGEKEKEAEAIAVRERGKGDLGSMAVGEFLEYAKMRGRG